jgi:hypothetical protein
MPLSVMAEKLVAQADRIGRAIAIKDCWWKVETWMIESVTASDQFCTLLYRFCDKLLSLSVLSVGTKWTH